MQSHVKTQLTSWQRPPFCFHSPFSPPVPAYPVCGLCCDLARYLGSSDYHARHRSRRASSAAVAFLAGGGREARGQTRRHGPRGQGRIRKAQVFFSRAGKVPLPCRSHVARSACIWDDLPHCLASKDRPAPGPGWARAHLPTSSDTRLLPIHLPSLCAEVTAGIQLFVKGL